MNNILYTVATSLLSTNCEALAFNDGHLELEHPGRNSEDEPTLPQICLSRDEALKLRTWLNGINLDVLPL